MGCGEWRIGWGEGLGRAINGARGRVAGQAAKTGKGKLEKCKQTREVEQRNIYFDNVEKNEAVENGSRDQHFRRQRDYHKAGQDDARNDDKKRQALRAHVNVGARSWCKEKMSKSKALRGVC